MCLHIYSRLTFKISFTVSKLAFSSLSLSLILLAIYYLLTRFLIVSMYVVYYLFSFFLLKKLTFLSSVSRSYTYINIMIWFMVHWSCSFFLIMSNFITPCCYLIFYLNNVYLHYICVCGFKTLISSFLLFRRIKKDI